MFLSTNTCDGKGVCIKKCPTKAIRLIGDKAFSCLTCGVCYENCPNHAISINTYGGHVIDRIKCNGCGICMHNCPIDNIHIEDGIVYGICSRCGVCLGTCPSNSRVDGFNLTKEKQLDFIKSLNVVLPLTNVPSKKEVIKEPKKATRSYLGTDLNKCIFCGRCEEYCPMSAIEVFIDRSSGICAECKICEDVCPNGSIKKFSVNKDTCTLCLSCFKACPHDAITVDDFKVSINHINQKATGIYISCLNCGVCSDEISNDSLQRIDGKLRYDPTADIGEDVLEDHYKAIDNCPVSTIKETDELLVIDDNVDNPTLTGFCVNCGACVLPCSETNARSIKVASWDGTVSDECISCGICTEVCPKGAITLNRKNIEVDLNKCVLCENCAVHCPKDAIPKTTMAKKVISGGFNYIDQRICISCGLCHDICPESAIEEDGDKFTVNEEKCIYCGACKNACPSNAFIFERNFKNSVDGA